MIGPIGVAVDTRGSVYVVEVGNHRVQKFDSQGKALLLWGGQGKNQGQFSFPEGIAILGDIVYVSDTLNHRIQKFTTSGAFLAQWQGFGTQNLFSMLPCEWVAGHSSSPPALVQRVASHSLGDREFQDCIGVAANAQGEVYVVDAGKHRLLKFDQEGAVYVADSGNHRIQKFTPDGTFITEFGEFGENDGQLNFPLGFAVSSDGTAVYVGDTFNQRIQIFTKEISTRPSS